MSSSVEISCAADVGVSNRRPVHGLLGPSAMQIVLQDGIDRAVRGPTDLDGALAGRLQGLAAMGFGQADDAEAGAKSLFGMRLRAQDQIDEGAGIGTDLFGAAPDLRGCPAGIAPMAVRHVRGDGGVLAVSGGADMGSNPLPFMENLDGTGGDPGPDLFLQELIRDRVVVLLDLDVVVEPDLALDPFRVVVRRHG